MESHDKMTKWALKEAEDFINTNEKMRIKVRLKLCPTKCKLLPVKSSRKKKQKKFKPQSYHKIIHYDRGKNQRLGKTI